MDRFNVYKQRKAIMCLTFWECPVCSDYTTTTAANKHTSGPCKAYAVKVMRATRKGFYHSSLQTDWSQLLYNNVPVSTIRFRKMLHIRLWPTLHMRGISKFYIKPRKISVWRGALRHKQQILWQHRTVEHSKLSEHTSSHRTKVQTWTIPNLSTT